MATKQLKKPKKTKEVILDEETFSDRLREFSDKHAPKFVIAGVAVMVLLAVIWGVSAYKESAEKSAGAEYAKVMTGWPEEPSTDKQAFEKVIPELEKFVQSHKGSKAAANARVDLAKAYAQVQRYEDAIKLCRQALDDVPAGLEIRPVIRYQLALTYMASGKTEDALAQWDEIKKEDFVGLTREALWQLGILSAKAGDYVRASEQFEQALKMEGNYPNSALIQSELASVKLKSGASAEAPKDAPAKKDAGS